MNYQIIYDLDLSELKEFTEQVMIKLNKDILPEAIKGAGSYFSKEWQTTAASKFKHTDSSYVQGIKEGIMYPFNSDPLRFKIIHTAKYAYYLEYGFDSFDMKKALATSSKVRISKEGNRYLIIPFEHGTPGTTTKRAMPKDVYSKATILRGTATGNDRNSYQEDTTTKGAKNLRQSIRLEKRMEGVQQGAKSYLESLIMIDNNPKKVERYNYKWGDKLADSNEGILRTAPKTYIISENGKQKTVTAPAHKTSPYSGMVRMSNNVQSPRVSKFSTGGASEANYSTYMTFRVMSEKSQGWIRPAQKPMNILKETVERCQPIVEQMLMDAVRIGLEEIRG